MAKIYSVPTEFENVPNIFDHLDDQKKYHELEAKWYADLTAWCRNRNQVEDHRYIGEIVRWPMADSQAEYMVAGLEDEDGDVQLIHLPVMDAWTYPDADLQTKERIIQKVEGNLKMRELFSKKS